MSRYESKYPLKMKKGDCIGISAPSSPFDMDDFQWGIDYLKGLGLKVHIPERIFDKRNYLAGSDEQRASVLENLFRDPGINAIMCARGGYGAMKLLGRIDSGIIRDNPKVFVGFSDVTALLNHLALELGLVCYHGPVVCSLRKSNQDTLFSLEQTLLSGPAGGLMAHNADVLVPGAAEGVIMGGNLATLCHLTGTPYQPDFSGAILMLEDVGEAPYRIDRMLTQMKIAGLFDHINAVVLGSFEQCGDTEHVAEIFYNEFRDFGIPVVRDFSFGHGSENLVFPVGAQGRIDTDALRLTW